MDYIIKQVDSATKGLRKDKVDEIVFAYEPIWAIGTGETASLQDIIEVLFLKLKNLSSPSLFIMKKK